MKSQWISVNDGMPDSQDEVLTFGERIFFYSIGYFTRDAWFDETGMTMKETVTHWQPLQSPSE